MRIRIGGTRTMRNRLDDLKPYIFTRDRLAIAIALALILIIVLCLFFCGQPEQSSEQQDSNRGAKLGVAPVVIQTQGGTYEFSIDGKALNSAVNDGKEKMAALVEVARVNGLFKIPGVTTHLNDGFNLVPLRLFNDWPLKLAPGRTKVAALSITKDGAQAGQSDDKDEPPYDNQATYKVKISESPIHADVEFPRHYPVTANPIVLEEERVPSDGELKYRIASDLVDSKATSAAVLVYKCGSDLRKDPVVLSMVITPGPGINYHLGTVTLRPLDERGECHTMWKQTVEAVAVVSGEDDYAILTSAVEITKSSSAAIYAFLIVVIIVVLASWIAGADSFKGRFQQKALNFVGLRFAETSYGKYSAAMLQAMFWTVVTLWGLIFVWLIRWELLSVTGQALIPLGIGGATAILTRAIVGSREVSIPKDLTPHLNRDEPKTPRFSELITSQGRPSLFKFQILATTAIVGVIVVREIYMRGAFPEIDENLLLLLAISGGSYVLNEATETDSQRLTNLADELKKMDAETRNQPDNKEKRADLEELLVKLRGWTRKG